MFQLFTAANNAPKYRIHPTYQIPNGISRGFSNIFYLVSIKHSLFDMFCLMDYGVKVVLGRDVWVEEDNTCMIQNVTTGYSFGIILHFIKYFFYIFLWKAYSSQLFGYYIKKVLADIIENQDLPVVLNIE